MKSANASPRRARVSGKKPPASPPVAPESAGTVLDTAANGNGASADASPAHRIERWAIERLVPYAKNARLHSDAQIAQIAASIRAWGWTYPILAAENGTIIAGHGRVLAARQLGMTEIPVMVARGWSDAQIKAYTIADNRLSENASWDREMLAAELSTLRDTFDMHLIGFTTGELDALLLAELPSLDAEYDEHTADDVKMVTCPNCGHEFPK